MGQAPRSTAHMDYHRSNAGALPADAPPPVLEGPQPLVSLRGRQQISQDPPPTIARGPLSMCKLHNSLFVL